MNENAAAGILHFYSGLQIISHKLCVHSVYCSIEYQRPLPYGITQCYLPPDTSEHTPP